jgi:hypothetical protein
MEFEQFKEYMEDVKNTIHNVSEKVDSVKEELSEVKIQTTKTNGRVTALEVFQKGIWWFVGAFVVSILGIFTAVGSALLIHHFK